MKSKGEIKEGSSKYSARLQLAQTARLAVWMVRERAMIYDFMTGRNTLCCNKSVLRRFWFSKEINDGYSQHWRTIRH
jgi:hypothetical protein